MVYAKVIIDHLNGGAVNNLDVLCTEIDAIQSLTKTTNQSNSTRQAGKETALSNTETHTFKGKCRNCGKVGHKRAQCPKPKDGGGRGGGGRGNGGGQGNGGSNITCNHYGLKGHKGADCWKNNPDKVPEWYQTKKATAGGAVDVQVMLCNLDIDEDAMCASQDSGRSVNSWLGEGTHRRNDNQELQDFAQDRL